MNVIKSDIRNELIQMGISDPILSILTNIEYMRIKLSNYVIK